MGCSAHPGAPGSSMVWYSVCGSMQAHAGPLNLHSFINETSETLVCGEVVQCGERMYPIEIKQQKKLNKVDGMERKIENFKYNL